VGQTDRRGKKKSRSRRSGTSKSRPEGRFLHATSSLRFPAHELEPLPESYGQTDLTLLAVHPCLVYASWEITPKDLKAATENASPEAKSLVSVLRFYYGSIAATPRWFDVEVNVEATNWYVPLWCPPQSYCAELGVKDKNDNFTVLARSNIVHTPPAAPSANVDVEYVLAGTSHRTENLPAKRSQATQDGIPQPVNMAEEGGRFSTLYSELGGERQGPTIEAEANRQPRENALAFLSRQSAHEETPAQMTESAMAKEAGIATKEASRAEAREISNRAPEPIDMTEEVRSEVSDIYTHRVREEQTREHRIPLGPTPQTSERIDRISDLTEANEKSFNLGASSSRR
jgi:hypothetical protein